MRLQRRLPAMQGTWLGGLPLRPRRWYCRPEPPPVGNQPPPASHPPPPAGHQPEEVLLAVSRTVGTDPEVARMVVTKLPPHTTVQLEAALEGTTGAQAAATVTPGATELRLVAIAAACPFIGFGILDNMLMIICGDWIDQTLCVTCGFSTMAAAALGNTISDAGGVYSGGLVEDMAATWGIEPPRLTRAQESMSITKFWERIGQVIGVVIGCLIGMFPLLLMDARKAEKLKQTKRMDEMYTGVLEGLSEMLGAEAAILMLVDADEGELVTRGRDNIPEFRCPLAEGVKGAVALSGKFMNIEDIRTTSYFDKVRHENYQGTGISVKSVLVLPVLGPDDKVLGVVEVINKVGEPHFSEKDEDVLSAICSHISTAIMSVDETEGAFKQTMQLCERSLRNQGYRLNSAQNARIDYLFRLVVEEVTTALDAEAAQLLVVDRTKEELYTKVADNLPPMRADINRGIMGKVVKTGEVLCIDDVSKSPYFDTLRHRNYQGNEITVRCVLCHPILDSNNQVIGVIEVINKKGKDGVFNSRDMAFVNAVASHLALNMQGPGTSLKSVLRMIGKQQETGRQQTSRNLQKVLNAAFNEADKNGDGVISKAEFEAAARRILAGTPIG
ncbi:Dual 3prime [Diplonema papillatum]|nr:Dual 3prime [Diplonema papillatum]